MHDSGKAGQDLPRLSQLLTPEDFEHEEHWTISDLAEDAVAMFTDRIREEFAAAAKEMADTLDEADLETLTRAFAHCKAANGIDAAAPGRMLASILLALGINDLGTGRREDTRRMLALRNARERLKKMGIQFVDEDTATAREGR